MIRRRKSNHIDKEIMYTPLCDYGCEKVAEFRFSNGKWCCSKNFEKCPNVRKTRTIQLRKYTQKGNESQKRIDKIKKSKALKRSTSRNFIGEMTSVSWLYHHYDIIFKIDMMYSPQCDYGCGNIANHQLRNGRWCCCKNAIECIGFKEQVALTKKGTKRSEEHKRRQSERLRNNPIIWTDGMRRKASEAKKGKKQKKESILKMLKTTREKYDIYELAQKCIKTKIERGLVVPFELRSAFKQYYSKVMHFTQISIKEKFSKEELKKRGVRTYHIDHIYSVKQGFLENAFPEVVGSKENLRLIEAKYNTSKQQKSDITLNELLETIKKRSQNDQGRTSF